jgi:hypothetical protein
MYPERYSTDATRRSPWIILERGRLFIMGRSIIENPSQFYEPALNWVKSFTKEWRGRTKIELGFEYINTGSTKWLYILIRELSELHNIPENLEISWYYEKGDEDMRDLGNIMKSLVECQFEMIEVDNMNGRLYRNLMSKRN